MKLNKEVRQYNAYFRTVSLHKRKSCPTCKEKLSGEEEVWSWGEYQDGRWYTVGYFCQCCYHDMVQSRLLNCGYEVYLVGYRGQPLPRWLTLRR